MTHKPQDSAQTIELDPSDYIDVVESHKELAAYVGTTTQEEVDHHRYEVMFNENIKHSFINLFPQTYWGWLKAIPKEYLFLSESELAEHFRLTSELGRLRIALWTEIDKVVQQWNTKSTYAGLTINPNRVVAGLCSLDVLESLLALDPFKAAWLLKRPKKYEEALEEALLVGVERVRELLLSPIYDKDNAFDSGAANVVLKAFDKIDKRLNGMPTQPIVQRNLNIHAKAAQPISDHTQLSIGELDEKIKELEARKDARLGLLEAPPSKDKD
jgi:hypothetical protein